MMAQNDSSASRPRRSDLTLLDRRGFAATVAAGILGGPAMHSAFAVAGAVQDEEKTQGSHNVKLAIQMNHIAKDAANPSDDELLLVTQLGVEYVTVWLRREKSSAEEFRRIVERYTGAGLNVWNIGNTLVHNMEEVTLNLPGRDEKIEQYLEYLQAMHAAGLTYTTYAHMGNGIWSTGAEPLRGARARVFELENAAAGRWDGRTFRGPLTHGRKYSQDEIWDNFAYFIEKVAPVAEKLGIRIGIHPDDPPVPELGGVPRCIFGNFDGYRRAMELADSPSIGLCLCVGCWLEGGELMGKSVVDTIRYFGERGKLFKIHFRNVDAPLPRFKETFLDNGYMDMYQVMKALVDVGFDGAAIPDHVPGMVGGGPVQVAYSIGYMRALLERAQLTTS